MATGTTTSENKDREDRDDVHQSSLRPGDVHSLLTEAFRSYGEPYAKEFVPRLAADILNVMREKKFPKRVKVQIKFLANS